MCRADQVRQRRESARRGGLKRSHLGDLISGEIFKVITRILMREEREKRHRGDSFPRERNIKSRIRAKGKRASPGNYFAFSGRSHRLNARGFSRKLEFSPISGPKLRPPKEVTLKHLSPGSGQRTSAGTSSDRGVPPAVRRTDPDRTIRT